MKPVSSLLSSVACGKCKTPLAHRSEENGVIKYKCLCFQKVRALLTCEHCKKQFLNFPHLVRKTNYCSLECYWVGTNKKQQKICVRCGKDFLIKSYLVEQGFGFYCGKSCWDELLKSQRRTLKCKQCNREFSLSQAVFKQKHKFCSKKCADDNKRDYVFKICRGCKKTFELPRHVVNRGLGRGSFCDRQCFVKYEGETSIEKILRLKLQKLKEPFKQEMKIGRYHADFYLPEKNLIIECDGEYWHRNKTEHDQKRDEFLKGLGYKILRLSEENIKSKQVNVLKLINL